MIDATRPDGLDSSGTGPLSTSLSAGKATQAVLNTHDQRRIFLVDDEVTIVVTLGEILRRHGFDVSCFTDPIKALEAIHANPPDLLIADVVMPEMSGIDLAIVIRETWPECTVLLFSGQFATSRLLEGAKDRGHNFEVLAKPVHPTEILERVVNLLGLDSPGQRPTSA